MYFWITRTCTCVMHVNHYFSLNINGFYCQQNKLYNIVYVYVESIVSDFKKKIHTLFMLNLLCSGVPHYRRNKIILKHSIPWVLQVIDLLYFYTVHDAKRHIQLIKDDYEFVYTTRILSNCKHVTTNPWLSCMHDKFY